MQAIILEPEQVDHIVHQELSSRLYDMKDMYHRLSRGETLPFHIFSKNPEDERIMIADEIVALETCLKWYDKICME